MRELTNKKYESYTYLSRYTNVPYYYDTANNRDVYGIGSNLKLSTAWVAHKVSPTDTLDYLALKYYANPTYWWIIANFNRILNPLDIRLIDYYTMIKIPAINGIAFGASNE